MAANLNKYSCLLGKDAGMQFCGAGFQSDKELCLLKHLELISFTCEKQNM